MTACLGKTYIWFILSLSGILKTLLHCLLVLNVVKKCRTNLIFFFVFSFLKRSFPFSSGCLKNYFFSCIFFQKFAFLIQALYPSIVDFCVQCEGQIHFLIFHMDNQLSQEHILLRVSFVCDLQGQLSYIRFPLTRGFVPGLSDLFYWYTCRFLYYYHIILIIVFLSVLKFSAVSPLT